jgi:hypothetical protein
MKPNWITAYSEIWFRKCGGQMPFTRYAKPLREAELAHGRDAAIKAWERYIANTEPNYASAHRFLSTIAMWLPKVVADRTVSDEREWT